jgi:hypothetical protein
MSVGSRLFNGITDRIDWPSAGNLINQPITISFWIKIGTLSHNGSIITIHRLGNTASGIDVHFQSNNVLQFSRVGASSLQVGSSSSVATSGSWANVVITHDGVIGTYSSVKMYKNGLPVSMATGLNGSNARSINGSVSLGGMIYNDDLNLLGNLCQVAVWNTVVSSDVISGLGSGKSPSLYMDGLIFYFRGDTDSLYDQVSNSLGVVDGTTESSDGPEIFYGESFSGSKASVSSDVYTSAIALDIYSSSVTSDDYIAIIS